MNVSFGHGYTDLIVDDVSIEATPEQREMILRWYREAMSDDRYEVRTTQLLHGSITTMRLKPVLNSED